MVCTLAVDGDDDVDVGNMVDDSVEADVDVDADADVDADVDVDADADVVAADASVVIVVVGDIISDTTLNTVDDADDNDADNDADNAEVDDNIEDDSSTLTKPKPDRIIPPSPPPLLLLSVVLDVVRTGNGIGTVLEPMITAVESKDMTVPWIVVGCAPCDSTKVVPATATERPLGLGEGAVSGSVGRIFTVDTGMVLEPRTMLPAYASGAGAAGGAAVVSWLGTSAEKEIVGGSEGGEGGVNSGTASLLM